MPYSPTRADATPMATDMAARLTTAGVSVVTRDTIVALCDDILCSAGLQLESNNVLSANNTTSASYVDVPGTSITFTAPIAKTYKVHCDFALFFSAGTAPAANVRLVVNGSNGPDMIVGAAALNTHIPLHLMHSAACAAGSNTIKLQWQTQGGAPTLNVNTFDYANYVVSG